jgi:hypothetical protein
MAEPIRALTDALIRRSSDRSPKNTRGGLRGAPDDRCDIVAAPRIANGWV